MPTTRRSTRRSAATSATVVPKTDVKAEEQDEEAEVERAGTEDKDDTGSMQVKKRRRGTQTQKQMQDEVADIDNSDGSGGDEAETPTSGSAVKKRKTRSRGPSKAATASSDKTSAKKSKLAGDTTSKAATSSDEPPRPRFWLYKSEPESRVSETAHDVKFSIDDLIARPNSTEPWDGVRNYAARNNLKAMRLGEQGFFYHSNCKEPGIVGIVEVVKEAVPDEQAFDPKAMYYDPKSSRDNPKWFQVEVKFVRRTKRLISLKELQEYKGKELSKMPLLTMGRLSVSEVPKECWDFILGLEDQ